MGVNSTAAESRYFLLIGPSGAGVTTTLNHFSGFGFMTVADVVPDALESVFEALAPIHASVAFSLKLPQTWADVPDEGELFQQVEQLAADLKAFLARTPQMKVLFLDAPETTLIQRYLGSGAPHPWEGNSLTQAVALDLRLHSILKPLKHYHIDTHSVPLDEVPLKVAKMVGVQAEPRHFTVNLMSFGFQYGIPLDAELVFDIRFLKNPFYDENLRPLTGLDQPVKDYIFSFPFAHTFLEQWTTLLAGMLPQYRQQGKTRLNIAIGCTGGQHRSVCMTDALATALRQTYPEYNVVVVNRETARWPQAPKLSATVGESP